MIAIVLGAMTSEYQSIVTAEQRRLGGNITLDDLEECMNQYWWQILTKESADSNDENNELTLSAFSGKCYNCGEEGHRANKCPKKKRNQNSQRSGKNSKKTNQKCYNCGKPRHLAYDCWEKEENSGKQPQGWKSSKNSERGMAAIDGSRCEILLCSITFPKKQALLNDKNIWIGDTGATQHMTSYSYGNKDR
jgi:hypothetical protein